MAAFELSAEQRRTLAAICDTLLARLSEEQEQDLLKQRPEVDPEHLRAFCRSTASDLGVPAAMETRIAQHLKPDEQMQLSLLLTAMSRGFGMFVLFGGWTPLADLPPQQRQDCLMSLQTSILGPKRKAFLQLKAFIGIQAFGRDTAAVNPHNHGKTRNSMWAAVDFDGPAPAEEAQAAAEAAGRREYIYTMLNSSITKDTTISVDAVVVGSGSGGAVVAAELAKAGKHVLVLEKGKYFRRSEITGIESDAFSKMYDAGGLQQTEDTGMSVLSGSTFGGGTAVNWSCSLRTPDYVKQEWATQHGLTAFTNGTFDVALDTVMERVGIREEGVAHNGNNQLFIDGCKKMGYHVTVAPQAMADTSPMAPGANYIGAGDRYAIKNSVLVTFLADAASAPTPAQFADRCFVERVLHEQGFAKGVEGRIVGADGVTEHRLTVQAPIVVVSCGSIQSPALLLRSGLPNQHRQIGKNLRLHPVSAVVGIMPRDSPDVGLSRGAPMTTVSNEVAPGPKGDNYGAKLECPLVHPGIMSAVIPWRNPATYKESMLDYRRSMVTIVLTRDKGAGEVRVDKSGLARLYYKTSEHDCQSLLDGMEKAMRITAAAGATKIAVGHFPEPVPLPPPSAPEARSVALDKLIAQVRKIGFPVFKVPIFSAHQMGTCRMGSDAKSSVVKPNCEAWECNGLYVVDASTFPTSSGTNPMVTTYGIAYMAAQGLKNVPTQKPRIAARL